MICLAGASSAFRCLHLHYFVVTEEMTTGMVNRDALNLSSVHSCLIPAESISGTDTIVANDRPFGHGKAGESIPVARPPLQDRARKAPGTLPDDGVSVADPDPLQQQRPHRFSVSLAPGHEPPQQRGGSRPGHTAGKEP